jgi:branched-chain amino acid transport system ATP-binding protein
VPPRSGNIRFEGRSIFGKPPHVISQAGIGYVPEERRIFPALTVDENLEVGTRQRLGWRTRLDARPAV